VFSIFFINWRIRRQRVKFGFGTWSRKEERKVSTWFEVTIATLAGLAFMKWSGLLPELDIDWPGMVESLWRALKGKRGILNTE